MLPTIGLILKAYQETGCTPIYGAYNDPLYPKRCCPITAICYSRGLVIPPDPDPSEVNLLEDLPKIEWGMLQEKTGMTGDELSSFIGGYDGSRAGISLSRFVEDAYNLGQQVREKLNPEPLTWTDTDIYGTEM